MTPEERQQSLANARRARQWLGDFFLLGLRSPMLKEDVGCLLKEFDRLDAGEQKRNAAGAKQGRLNAQYGHLGGRPRKTTTKKRGKK